MPVIPKLFGLLALCFVVACGLLSGAGAALAQSCSFSITNLDFGAIDVTANTTISGTGTFNATCTGTAGQTIVICPNFGAGTGGSDGDGVMRQLTNGTNFINFNLYKGSGLNAVWGSYVHGYGTAVPPPITMTLSASGKGTRSRTIYTKIPAGQQSTPVGTYNSVFSGYDVQVFYEYSTTGTCDTVSGALQGSPTFMVQSMIIPRCTVSASELNFGSIGAITRNVDATNTLSVVCTSGAPYSIGLDGGLTGASNPATRKMSFGSNQITYGLYRNSGRTLPWGTANDGLAQGATGTGATQNFKVFGRVPTQPTPLPGAYADTIVVTVTY